MLICLPTPLDEHREPDLSAVLGAAESLARRLRQASWWSSRARPTPAPRATSWRRSWSAPACAPGADFSLAFSPERVDPGSADCTTAYHAQGGRRADARVHARGRRRLYGLAHRHVVPVSSPEVAEMTKLLENIFRSVNIALVNELAVLCDRMGIDVWEVIDAAATKPFGYMPF